MDPFRACLAFGPLAIYVLLLGLINLSRRPLLVSGTRDAAALGLALAGFVLIGPFELFLPDASAARIGPFVWALLAAFYGLCLVLVLLQLRPRLVIYNMSTDELRPVLADLVAELDPDARWAGDNLTLPGLSVQLHVDSIPWMRNISLVASGWHQNYLGWRRLELALAAALREVRSVRRWQGLVFLIPAINILLMLIAVVVIDPQALAQAMFDMLRF